MDIVAPARAVGAPVAAVPPARGRRSGAGSARGAPRGGRRPFAAPVLPAPSVPLLAFAVPLALAACGGGGGGPVRDAGPADSGPPVCPGAPVPPGGCASDADCGPGEACVAGADGEGDPVTLVPRCAVPEGAGAPGDACEGPAACASALCAYPGNCLAPCAADADCAGDARCRRVDVRWRGDASGRALACAPRLVVPPGVDAQVLVETRNGALRAADAPVDLTIPAFGEGLAVVEDRCGGRPLPRSLGVLTEPPIALFDVEQATIGAPAQPNPVDRVHPAVVAIPAGLRLDPTWSGSDYALGLDADADADADVTRVSWARPPGSRLDLALFYVGPADLAPEGDRGPPAVAAALDEAEALLAPAGIAFGRVTQHRVGGALAEALGVVEVEPGGRRPDLERLFRLSVGVRGVPVFFVRQLEGGPIGLAGGVPAPMGLPGTPGSGLALAYDVLGPGGGAGELTLGRALAHELGHYLGLWHTTERVGVVLDPLEDTPICPIGLDGSAGTAPDGVLDADECSGGFGAENLMFHTASGTELTPGQATVLGRGPLVY